MKTQSIDNFLVQKKLAKSELAKELGLSKNKAMVGIFLDKALSGAKERTMFEVLMGLKDVDVNVVVLADTNMELAGMAKVLNYNRTNRRRLLESADMALIFDFSDIEELLLNGIIPVSAARPEISDYNPNHETGNSFVYSKKTPWGIFAALVRAIETFKFPYDWKHIVRQGVNSVDHN